MREEWLLIRGIFFCLQIATAICDCTTLLLWQIAQMLLLLWGIQQDTHLQVQNISSTNKIFNDFTCNVYMILA